MLILDVCACLAGAVTLKVLCIKYFKFVHSFSTYLVEKYYYHKQNEINYKSPISFDTD